MKSAIFLKHITVAYEAVYIFKVFYLNHRRRKNIQFIQHIQRNFHLSNGKIAYFTLHSSKLKEFETSDCVRRRKEMNIKVSTQMKINI